MKEKSITLTPLVSNTNAEFEWGSFNFGIWDFVLCHVGW